MSARSSHAVRGWPLAVLVLTAGWLACWWPVLTGGEVLFVKDLAHFALPAKHHMVEAWRAGQVPLWTPHVGGGMPFLADPSNQALYPLNGILLLHPSLEVALSWMVLVHVLLAGIGCHALLRSLQVSTAVALPVALLWSVSGYVVSILDNVNYLPAVAWAPLGLAAFAHGLRTGAPWTTAVSALCLALMVLAGDAPGALMFGLAAALLTVFQTGTAMRGGVPARMVHLAGTGVLALALSSAQVLPTLELVAESIRAHGLTLAERQAWSLPPWRLVELVQPFTFGTRFSDLHYAGAALYPRKTVPWADSVYLGLVPVLLALAALGRPPARPWLVVAAVALLLALGRHTPVDAWLSSWVPLLDAARYPEKFVLWLSLALCVLAGLGAQGLRERLPRPGPRPWRAFPRVLLSAAVVGIVLALVVVPSRLVLGEAANTHSLFWSGRFGLELTHAGGLLLHGALAALVALVLCWVPRRHAGAAVLVALWAGALDAGWMHFRHVPRMPLALAERGPDPWIRDWILNDRGRSDLRVWFDAGPREDHVQMTASPLLADTLQALAGRRDVDPRPYFNHFASLRRRARLRPNSGIVHGVRYLNAEWSPLRLWGYRHLREDLFRQDGPALLQRTGVERVITGYRHRMLELDDPRLEPVAEVAAMDLRILRVRDPVPRARLAPRSRNATAEQRATRTLDRSTLRDPGEVLVDAVDGGSAGPPLSQVDLPGGEVTLEHAAPGRFHLQVRSPYPEAYLVLTESWFPGWRASIDGRPARVERADHRFLAVRVPAGERRVSLEYHSALFETGAVVSALALAVCVVLVLLPARRKQGPAPV